MSEPYISQISLFGNTFAPRGWSLCEGQLLPIAQNQALFALLGTAYGGDGRTTLALPDYRARVPVGVGTSTTGYTRTWGQKGGVDSVTLKTSTMPAHSHDAAINTTSSGSLNGTTTCNTEVKCNNAAITSSDPKDNVWGKLTGDGIYDNTPGTDEIMHGGAVEVAVDLSPVTVDLDIEIDTISIHNQGGGQPHENRPPFLGVLFCIALVGLFPPRSD